jgi:ABC-type uncharacterized transport system involved in gliding motility auxiliary subunit
MAKKQQNNAERYAFIGLIVAGVALVATLLLGLVDGLVALKFVTQLSLNVNLWLSISAALVVLGLAAYAIMAPEKVARFFTGRQARYGSNTLIMSLAFIGILIVVNLLTLQNPKVLADLTEGKQNTLAPQTIQALTSLPDKVTAIGFFTSQTPSETARQLLTRYKEASNGKFDYSIVDPNQQPVLAKKYNITGDGKIALTMGKASQVASSADETSIDQALILLINPQTRVVYFLTGHGEANIDGTDNTAMSQARTTLENKSYTVKTLDLATTGTIPSDAKVIVIAGPKTPLLDQEMATIKAWVAKGGSLVVMDDPTPFTNIGSNPDPVADYLKTDWGITFDNDVVIDNATTNPLIAVGAPYSGASSPIIEQIKSYTIMLQARSLTLSKTLPQDVLLTDLLQTGPTSQSTQHISWGKTDLSFLQNPNAPLSPDLNVDIPGPVSLAAAGENTSTSPSGRVVAFGNSLFANDQYFSSPYANSDVFVNSVDWAAHQDNLISITPRAAVTRTYNPPSTLWLIAILLGTVCVLPGLVIGAGLYSWLERRRKG